MMSVALAGRMRGRAEIEWQDRAWRLLENQGQLECDDWTYAGMAAGTLGAVLARPPTVSLARGLVGGAGLGSFAGFVGYMAWRYGVHGGRFPEPKPELKTELST